jgi:hypothetical protein
MPRLRIDRVWVALCVLGFPAASHHTCGDARSAPVCRRIADAIGVASSRAQDVDAPNAQGSDVDHSKALAEHARRLAAEIRASATAPAHDGGSFGPGSRQRKELLSVLRLRDSSSLEIRNATAASEPLQTFVVIYRVSRSKAPLKAMDARVELVQRQQGRLEIKASGRLQFTPTMCTDTDTPITPADRELVTDSEPVQLAPDRTAFVVHLRCATSQPSSEGEERDTILVEWQGSALTQVFRFEDSRSELDRVSNIESDERTQLTTAPSQHAGYFDLRLRVERVQKHIASDGSPDAPLKSEIRDYNYQRSGRGYLLRAEGAQ